VGAVTAKPKRVREPRKRPPSPADEADTQALECAVQYMIEHVLSGWDHSRPLGSLNRGDLRKLADWAITGWIVERSKQAQCDEQTASELNFSAGFVGPT